MEPILHHGDGRPFSEVNARCTSTIYLSKMAAITIVHFGYLINDDVRLLLCTALHFVIIVSFSCRLRRKFSNKKHNND